MTRHKIIIVGIITAVIAGVAIFAACKKDNSNEMVNQNQSFVQKAMAQNDTIYVPTNLKKVGGPPNYMCDEDGGSCLGTVIIRPKDGLNVHHVRDVFIGLVEADDAEDGDITKRGIIADNTDLFAQFIQAAWIGRIINETAFVSVTRHNDYNYLFSFRFINENGGSTYFMIGDDMTIFDSQVISVVLVEDDEDEDEIITGPPTVRPVYIE